MSGDSTRSPRSRRRAGDDRAVRVAHRDVGAHQDELVGEDHAVLEHPLVDERRARALRGERDRDRREVGGERRPRTVLDLDLVLADVARDDEVLVAGHDDVVAVELGAQAEALEDEADHAQVARDRVADAQLAAGDAGERHEGADLDVVGPDRVVAAVQVLRAVDREHVRADALDPGAHAHEHPREVLDVRLAGGVADDGQPGRAGGGQQRVLGRHHRRLVHEDVARAQARGRAQLDVARVLEGRAERGEGVEVRDPGAGGR